MVDAKAERGLARLIAGARSVARAILGRPPSDWAGPDHSRGAAASAGDVAIDNRHEIVCFPSKDACDSDALLRRLAESGHRVFSPPPGRLTFDSLDALRRERGFGATVSVVRDPAWRPLAERFRAERGWPIAENPADGPDFPHALAGAFPKLSVVIVTWNNRELNRLCLESLFARTEWPNLEVVAVDNGSSDGTRELLSEFARRHANLTVVALAENRGFPAACNIGLSQATGDFLALLNNDTVVTRGWAAALIAHLARNPRLGLVGPVTNAIANEARIDVGYADLARLPGWAADWVRAHDGDAFEIPMLAFFCVVMRREVFASVGGLDERFGVGMFEDGDYNRRARAKGWQVRCARDAFVHHWQKASFRQLGRDAYFELYEENRRKYEEKWSGG